MSEPNFIRHVRSAKAELLMAREHCDNRERPVMEAMLEAITRLLDGRATDDPIHRRE